MLYGNSSKCGGTLFTISSCLLLGMMPTHGGLAPGDVSVSTSILFALHLQNLQSGTVTM